MKRFEFSYRGRDDDMHFVVVYDDALVSACERVLCRKITANEINTTSLHKNYFITGWENTNFTIHEQPYQPSSHVTMPVVAIKGDANIKVVNSILEGLI